MNNVSKKALIGSNVKIGNFTTINDDVIIGDNVEISSCVLIDNGARISNNVKIGHGSAIAITPQDLKFEGEETIFEIGENTIVRECVTLNRGTKQSGKSSVGKNCLLMAYTHVAHDCIIGDNVILANLVNMGGHVEIDDWAIVGGMVPIHQFVRIGMHSLIAAGFRTMKDVPPYIISGNLPMQYEGVNIIGLRRRGFTSEQIKKIGDIYHILYKSGLNISDALKKIKNEHEMKDEAKVIIDFIETSSRGIIGGER